MIFTTVPVTLAYKLITLFSITFCAASLAFPVHLILGDILTEVYGYQYASKVIWASMLSSVLFALSLYGFTAIPSPDLWVSQEPYYHFISEDALRLSISATFALAVTTNDEFLGRN